MSQAATVSALQALHGLVAESLAARIKQDMEDDVPTDAATMGAAIKFLKDNNISAEPGESNELDDLRRKMTEASEKRKKRAANVLEFAREDLKQATGG